MIGGLGQMEAGLAIIASLLAIIQGTVWLINGIQNHRAKKILNAAGSVGFESMSEPQDRWDTTHGTASSLESAAATLHTDAVSQRLHASNALPSAPPTGGAWNHGSGDDSTFAHANGRSMTPEAVVEYWQTQSRFKRFARGIWHAILVAFLPVFSFASPLGLAVVVLFPFRDSVADPTLYEDGPTSLLAVGLILLIPGIFAFRHRPTSSVHKWVRRICLVVAVLLAILFFCLIAFVEPS